MENKTATPVRVAASPPAQLLYLLKATRPRQWTKNGLIFLAFFFTVGEHGVAGLSGELALLGKVTLALLLFSMLTGPTYILNDWVDIKRDRLHPKKRFRPLASGKLNPVLALSSAAIMSVVAVAVSFALDRDFGLAALAYLGLMTGYTLALKNIVILDVFAISGGFVLRAVAGALVINVPVSPWLYVMTSLGALMIALGKRRGETTLVGERAGTREVLEQYTLPVLDQLMSVVAPAAVVAYTLYTFTAPNLPGNHAMMLTIPFVLYGIFRYLFLVHRRDVGGTPEEILLTDKPLLLNSLLWLATAVTILLTSR